MTESLETAKQRAAASHCARRPSTNLWGWLLAVAPLVALGPAVTSASEFFSAITGGVEQPDEKVLATELGCLWLSAALLAACAVLGVVMAALDRRRLVRSGVTYPFHPALGALPILYLVGRTVVLGKRGGAGAPLLLVHIACCTAAGSAFFEEVLAIGLLHGLQSL